MDEAKSLQSDLMEYRKLVEEVKKKFGDVASEMDEFEITLQKTKMGGQIAAVAGGVISTVGFGLSFVTFGASLGLAVAGGIVGGAGGVTAGGACIFDYTASQKTLEETNKLLEKLNDSKERLLHKCHRISISLYDTDRMPAWTSFWSNLVGGSAKVTWNLAWKVIKTTVQSGLKLTDLSIDVASGTVTVVRSLGKIGTTLHVAGGVIGALLIPLDIGFLVYHAYQVANPTEHEVSKTLREIASKLTCPSEHDIRDMIRELRGARLSNR